MTADELDRLLHDRFNLGRGDVIAALKSLPPRRPGAASLTAEQSLPPTLPPASGSANRKSGNAG
jgi:hypothetical protein